MAKPDITMFFPAYNEEGNIGGIIENAVAILEESANNYEVLVVLYEKTTDRTAEIVERYSRKNPRVRLVRQPADDGGVGRAYRLGFEAARYENVFYADGDNQFDLNEFGKFLPHIGNYDIIAGYRKKRQDPFFRLVTSKTYHLLNRLLFGARDRDMDCAFRLAKKGKILGLGLISRGGLATVEMFVKARRKGLRIKRIGVTHYPRPNGSSCFEGGISSVPKVSVVLGVLHEMKALRRNIREMA